MGGTASRAGCYFQQLSGRRFRPAVASRGLERRSLNVGVLESIFTGC